MGHITFQYGPYYRPTPAPPQGRGAERLSHKAYKTYWSYKSYKPNKPLLPPLGGLRGANMGHITLPKGRWQVALSKKRSRLFCRSAHLEYFCKLEEQALPLPSKHCTTSGKNKNTK